MIEDLAREIRKLKIRLDDYLEQEGEYVKAVKNCLSKFTDLIGSIENSKTGTESAQETKNLRLDALRALNETMKRQSMAEHEKSHLLESYGALILSLEKESGSSPSLNT